jgi:hypothetical protein
MVMDSEAVRAVPIVPADICKRDIFCRNRKSDAAQWAERNIRYPQLIGPIGNR